MDLSIQLRHSLKLEHNIAMRISTAQILSLPSASLDRVIEHVLEHPEKFDSKPGSENGTGRNLVVIGPNMYRERSGESGVNATSSRNGKRIVIPCTNLDIAIETPEFRPEDFIDGVYSTEKDHQEQTPKFKPSKNLMAGSIGLEMRQIPEKLKGCRGALTVYNRLTSQKRWIAKTMNEVYNTLGKKQSEFIKTLDPTFFSTLTIKDVSHIQGYDESTFSRLLRNRFVAIRHDNRECVIPTSFLCPTRDDVFFYIGVNRLNKGFEQEFWTGKASSDKALADSHKMNRRTVAKYRLLGGIPGCYERKSTYDSGQLQQRYRIVTTLEQFTLDPNAAMASYLARVSSKGCRRKHLRNS